MKNSQTNLKAIRAVKKDLAKVNVTEVAAYLQCTRQNIYKHLDEDNAEKVSLPHLKKISDAIKEVVKIQIQNQKKTLSAIIN